VVVFGEKRTNPTPPYSCCYNTSHTCCDGSCETLAFSDFRGEMSPKPSEGRGSGITPTQQQDAHNGDVFRAEPHHDPCTQKIRYDAVVSFDLGLTHESTQAADVEAVHLPVAVSDYVGKGDRYEHGEKDVVYLERLRAGAVEEYREEANGDVEDLSGYLMFMDLSSSAVASSDTCRAYAHERPPFLVDGNQAHRTRAPAHLSPVVLVRLGWR
jgi:hypothetical protein